MTQDEMIGYWADDMASAIRDLKVEVSKLRELLAIVYAETNPQISDLIAPYEPDSPATEGT